MADHIDSYLAYLRRRGRADATIENYGGVLRRIDRDLPHGLAHAHRDELRDWIYSPGRTTAATAHYRSIVCVFFRWATDPREPRLDWNPAALLPDAPTLPHRSPRPLTVEQLRDILTRAREPYRTWIILAAYGGLRCCEIAALDVEHVNADTIWVHGKGDHERTIPTDPYVWRAVKDLPPGPVARLADGRRASRQYVARRGNLHLHRRLKLGDVTMHRFRHTFATLLYQATGDVLLVRQLLGHASVSTTQVYAQVATAAMRAAVATLPRVIGPAAGAA